MTSSERSSEAGFLDQIWPLRSKFGVTRVADVTRLDTIGMPVFSATRPEPYQSLLSQSNGKGATVPLAIISALMEAYERYFGEQRDTEVLRSSYRQLIDVDEPAIDPASLILSSGSDWDHEALLDWVQCEELVGSARMAVPTQAIYTPYARFENQAYLFRSVSHGLAAGPSIADATLRAIFELIERDSASFGELLPPSGCRWIPKSLGDPWDGYVGRAEAEGLRVEFYRFDSVLGPPAWYCLVEDQASEDLMLTNSGTAFHLDESTGVTSALAEALQSRAGVISGAREDLSRDMDVRGLNVDEHRARLAEWRAIWPVSTAEHLPLQDHSTHDIERDLETVIELLRVCGFSTVLRKRLTGTFDLPFEVVRVVIPGLEFVCDDPRRAGRRFRKGKVHSAL